MLIIKIIKKVDSGKVFAYYPNLLVTPIGVAYVDLPINEFFNSYKKKITNLVYIFKDWKKTGINKLKFFESKEQLLQLLILLDFRFSFVLTVVFEKYTDRKQIPPRSLTLDVGNEGPGKSHNSRMITRHSCELRKYLFDNYYQPGVDVGDKLTFSLSIAPLLKHYRSWAPLFKEEDEILEFCSQLAYIAVVFDDIERDFIKSNKANKDFDTLFPSLVLAQDKENGFSVIAYMLPPDKFVIGLEAKDTPNIIFEVINNKYSNHNKLNFFGNLKWTQSTIFAHKE